MKLEQKQINFRFILFGWGIGWGIAYILDFFFSKYPIYQYIKLTILILILVLLVVYKAVSKNVNMVTVSSKIEQYIKYSTYALVVPFLLALAVDFFLKGEMLKYKNLVNLILGIVLIIIAISGIILNYLTVKLTKEN